MQSPSKLGRRKRTRPVLGSSLRRLLTGISEGLSKHPPGDRPPALTDRAKIMLQIPTLHTCRMIVPCGDHQTAAIARLSHCKIIIHKRKHHKNTTKYIQYELAVIEKRF